MEFARIHLFLGEESSALDALDLAFNERSASLVYLNVDPFFAPLRSDPRFQSLLFRIGLSARK